VAIHFTKRISRRYEITNKPSTFTTETLKKQTKAIESLATTVASNPPVAASSYIAGDETTWDGTTEERRTSGDEGPPLWLVLGTTYSSTATSASARCLGTSHT
jgi:hypothetical protein